MRGLGHLVEEGIERPHPMLRQQLQPVVQCQAGREVSSTWRKTYTNNYVTYVSPHGCHVLDTLLWWLSYEQCSKIRVR
jgi:hypothetical protein